MENALSLTTCSLLPVTPISLPSPLPSSNLTFSRLNRFAAVEGQRRSKSILIRNAFGSDENVQFNGFPNIPNKIFMEEVFGAVENKIQQKLSRVGVCEALLEFIVSLSLRIRRVSLINGFYSVIGAEYGEGFETFRPEGPLKVDVDFLNDRMQEGFLQRIRYAMKPDEAYGLIFSWDVVADTQALKLRAWEQLASEEGKEIPKDDSVQKSLLHADADHVLQKVLRWEEAEDDVERLKSRLSQLYYDNLVNFSEPLEGLKEWLDAVNTSRIPCAVVSSLDRKNMVSTLERMGLKNYFQAIVSEEDGMESMAHRFLSASVKLDRKPSKCVVFEDDPRGIAAAHICTMMAIALIGAHPAYDLGQADLAVANFNDLSVINLRRLFAHKGSTFMELQKQVTEKTPPKRKLTIDTIF